jgi:hypothetical protein
MIPDVIYKVLTPDMTSGYKCEGGISSLRKWEIGKWEEAWGEGQLGTMHSETEPNWFYCLENPLLAMLHKTLDFIGYRDPLILLEGEGEGSCQRDENIVRGYRRMRMLKVIATPIITPEQYVRYEILASLEVYKEASYVEWAERWLSGQDRTRESARTEGNKARAVERPAGEEARGQPPVPWNKVKKALIKKMAGSCKTPEEMMLDKFEVMWAAGSAEMAAFSATRLLAFPPQGPTGWRAGPVVAANYAFIAREGKHLDLVRIAQKAMED